jgi:hypothetical protein
MRKHPIASELPPEVAAFLRQQEEHTSRRPSCPCPKCEQARQFQWHAQRARQFRFVWADAIWPAGSFLIRWKCVLCGTTFTHYPLGVDPHKRYVRLDRAAFAGTYVSTPGLSYAAVVKRNGRPLTYQDPACDEAALEAAKSAEPAPRQLSGSTVWRWVGDFAKREIADAERRMQQLVGHVDLASFHVPAGKYRTRERRDELVQCRRVLAALAVFETPTVSGRVDVPP